MEKADPNLISSMNRLAIAYRGSVCANILFLLSKRVSWFYCNS